MHETIDKLGASRYFDGASQGTPLVCGVRGIRFLLNSQFIRFNVGMGNSYVKMLALKLIIKLLIRKGVKKLYFWKFNNCN